MPTFYHPDKWLSRQYSHMTIDKINNRMYQLQYINNISYYPLVVVVISFTFSENGAGKNGGSSKFGSLLHSQMWYDERTDNIDIFFLNIDSFIPGFIKLWREWRFLWFRGLMNPLLEISKHVSLQLKVARSCTKWAYLFVFSIFLTSIEYSSGQVSSKMCIDFVVFSCITMSGFNFVTIMSGGNVPPFTAVCPGISLYTVYLVISIFLTMYLY